MSRIGKAIIHIPADVKIAVDGQNIQVEGKLEGSEGVAVLADLPGLEPGVVLAVVRGGGGQQLHPPVVIQIRDGIVPHGGIVILPEGIEAVFDQGELLDKIVGIDVVCPGADTQREQHHEGKCNGNDFFHVHFLSDFRFVVYSF